MGHETFPNQDITERTEIGAIEVLKFEHPTRVERQPRELSHFFRLRWVHPSVISRISLGPRSHKGSDERSKAKSSKWHSIFMTQFGGV